MQKTLALIRQRYGGAEGYLSRNCNISSQEDYEAIRRSVLVPSW